MANKEQLAMLSRGVDAWNIWRQATSERIDLRGADLRGARLSRAALRDADLWAANLDDADLSAADLRRTDLRNASLHGSIVREAQLGSADLSGASLRGADLRGSALRDAILRRSNLRGAKLQETLLHGCDMREAELTGAKLTQANARWANLSQANLFWATLSEVDLTRANLHAAQLGGADLSGATLYKANLQNAKLRDVRLSHANLSGADLSGADLRGADLSRSALIETQLLRADLTGCRIHGIAAWDVVLDDNTRQANLVITPPGQAAITVDNLEVAQFIYLMLNNQRIRQVIDTIGKKAVLILGRFGPRERKAVLDGLRQRLRECDYLPILFDFDVPIDRDITETVTLLARMARFIIADLTSSSSIPKELEAIVPTVAVPVQPLLEGATAPYTMFKDYWKYHWVLKPHRYTGISQLLDSLQEAVIGPSEQKVVELRALRSAAAEG